MPSVGYGDLMDLLESLESGELVCMQSSDKQALMHVFCRLPVRTSVCSEVLVASAEGHTQRGSAPDEGQGMNRKAAARHGPAAGCFEEMVGQLQFQLDAHHHLHLGHERNMLVRGVLERRLCSWQPARRPTPDTILSTCPELSRYSTA